MKNLLILVPNLQLGGQERVAVNTAEIMADTCNITFVVFDGRDAVYAPPCALIDLAIPAVPGKFAKMKNAVRRAGEFSFDAYRISLQTMKYPIAVYMDDSCPCDGL